MRSKFAFLLLLSSFIALESCKREEEAVVDCFGNGLETSLSVKIASDNTKKVNTSVTYIGSQTIESIQWNFGDNSNTTTTATSVEHIYTSTGTYDVTANVKFTSGCSVSPKKTITIQ